MDLKSILTRLDRLSATVAPPGGPHVVAYLPRNGREPADAPAEQFTTHPAPRASVIHYDPANPPAELIALREQDALAKASHRT
jgi:hypothetical protein